MTPEERSQQVRLDRERILDAAAEIVGSEGLPALTMRRIGAELGADPTAVYRHFRSKREMLTELADRLFATEPEVAPDGPWRDRLRASMWHGLRRYATHLDLGLLLAGQPDDLPSLVRIREGNLRLLTEVGLSLPEAARLSHLIETTVVGCGLFFAVSGWTTDDPDAELAAMRRAYGQLDPERAPLSHAAAPHLFPGPDAMFEQLVEIMLDEVQRALAAESEAVRCA